MSLLRCSKNFENNLKLMKLMPETFFKIFKPPTPFRPKIHFLLKDDNHVVAQGFSSILEKPGAYLVSRKHKSWLDQTRPDIFKNRAKTYTCTSLPNFR